MDSPIGREIVQNMIDDGHRSPGARRVMRNLGITLAAAFIFATVFTVWTPASLNPGELAGQLISSLD